MRIWLQIQGSSPTMKNDFEEIIRTSNTAHLLPSSRTYWMRGGRYACYCGTPTTNLNIFPIIFEHGKICIAIFE